jgi:Tol biopolymer transport system component
VVFVSKRGGTSEVWAINLDGSNLRQLTDAGEYVRFPFWNRP